MAKQICNLEQVPATGFQHKSLAFTLVLSGVKCNRPFPLKQTPAETMTWMKIAVDYSVQNWKRRIEYLYSHNFGEKWNKFVFNFRNVAGPLPYKPINLGIKISHACREIAFCPVGYFSLSHPVLHCVPKKHVTTFSMISWSRTIRLQRFLAHLLPRV